jgi:hypothetical protein
MNHLHFWQEVAVIIASVVAIVAGIGGVIIRTGRAHIASAVRTSVDSAIGPVQLELKTMNGELMRVRIVEQKIENGLSTDVAELKESVRRVEDRVNAYLDERARQHG